MPVLYGSPLSPFVRKVAVVLEEKGVAYEWKPVRPHDRDEEFKKISPLGKIPAFRDERVALADSSVISMYLEKTYPQVPLYPADAVNLARAMWFEEYFDGAMIVPMNTIYFEKFFNPKFYNNPTDEKKLAEAEAALPPLLDYLESQVNSEQWMVGDSFSIADISLAVGFADLGFARFDVDAARYPKFAAYVKRIHARASFVKCAASTHEFVRKMEEKLALAHKK
jgi:glutathione S-transferase